MTPIPKEQRNGKMPDHRQHLLLCPEAVYPVPVGTDVHAGASYSDVQKWSTTRSRNMLNKKSIKYNWHEADVTVLEGVLARGDRKIGQAILRGL